MFPIRVQHKAYFRYQVKLIRSTFYELLLLIYFGSKSKEIQMKLDM